MRSGDLRLAMLRMVRTVFSGSVLGGVWGASIGRFSDRRQLVVATRRQSRVYVPCKRRVQLRNPYLSTITGLAVLVSALYCFASARHFPVRWLT